MKTLRSGFRDTLLKYATWVYVPNNPTRKKFGDLLFKLAAKVSPDKK